LRSEVNAIHQNGAELVIIGNGKPHHAETFRKDLKLASPIYVDPKLGTYRALKLERGIWKTFQPIVWWHALKAFRQGFRQKSTTGDPWQHGGTFVILPNGQVIYHYISKHAGDHPNPKDFINSLTTVVKQV
jgi:peroxiredoxin